MLRLFALLIPLFLTLGSPAEEPLQILPGDPEPIRKELYSFNSNLLMATALQGINYSSPEFRKSIEGLRPGGLRFPGGTTANNYLWKEDSFSEQEDDKTEWAAQQLALFRKIGRPYDLPGYAALCREFGMTPIYVLNIYEETPESVVELFNRFDELGLGVNAVELGNEPYWDPRSLMNVWKYMDYCRPLAEAIRKHRPKVQIGACFGPLREGSPYPEKWNAPLAQQTWFDAIVYHEYYGGQGFAMEEGAELPLEAVLHPESFIDEPVQYFEELLPHKPIWFTEWNIGAKGLQQWKSKGAELLFIGASTIRLLEHQNKFDWSCFHQIYEAKFGTFYHNRDEGRVVLPSYQAFQLLRGAWEGATEFHEIPSAPEAKIRGFATSDGKELRYFLLNRGPEEQPVVLPNERVDRSALTLAVHPERELLLSETLSSVLQLEENTLTLPPFSLTLVGSPSVVERAKQSDARETGDLFPARPHLTLWYPPYARNPPRVAPDGSYTVDLDALAGKTTAVIKMDLSGTSPKQGETFVLTFDRKSTHSLGLVARLPNESEGSWIQLLPKEEPTRLEFQYDAKLNNGEVSFLLSDSAIAKGGQVTLKNFRLVRVTE